mmetsp:Transcript_5329/g.7677  ORF Transcript_5329/g.7677 Transcript_5329/m.7677 type:complete len:532 (+) Transcript_5329:86-1681(+)
MVARELRGSLFVFFLVTPSFFALTTRLHSFSSNSLNHDFVTYGIQNRICWSFKASLEDDSYFDLDGKEAEDFNPLLMDGNLDEIFKMVSNDDLSEVEEMHRIASNDERNGVGPPGSFMKQMPTDKLEALVAKMESIIVENDGPEAFSQSDDNDAPYLDPDTYANYSDNLNEDGSLSLQPKSDLSSFNSLPELGGNKMNLKSLVNSRPDVPDSYFSTNTTATSDSSLLEKLFESKPGNAHEVDEDLHARIMAGEEAFQKQSESFQELLKGGTNENANKAGFKLRQKVIEKKQREDMDRLENEMINFEKILDEKEGKIDAKTAVCPKCNFPLSKIEIESGTEEGLCRVCLADQISTESSFEGTKRNYPSYSRHKSYRNNFSSPSRSFTTSSPKYAQKASPPVSTENTNLSHLSSEKRSSQRKDPPTLVPGGEEVKDLKRRVLALQQQVQKYKRHIEVLERQRQNEEEENIRLKQRIRQLEEDLLNTQGDTPPDSGNEGVNKEDTVASWVEVTDPDTGEIFFWNEDTEEMKWDM